MLTNRIGRPMCATILALSMLLATNVFASPPAQSGVVSRADFPDSAFIVDQKSGLLVVLGIDPVEFCSGPADADEITFMIVDVQVDPERIALFAKGQLRASVWDFVEFDCELFFAKLPLATGMAMVQSTDNDFFLSSGPNANAYGFSARGKLYDSDGAQVHLNAVFRAQWDKQADEAIVKSSKVTLR